MSNDGSVRGADVRAIRTAIVGLALAVVTAAYVLQDLDAFWILVITFIVIAFSFVQTLLDL